MKFAVILVAALIAGPALAQDVGAGRTLAQTWCAGCHNVAPGAVTMKEGAPPPFQIIADSKNTTQAGLAAFLSMNHGRMPDYSLTRKEIRDVSAYILSLKK